VKSTGPEICLFGDSCLWFSHYTVIGQMPLVFSLPYTTALASVCVSLLCSMRS